MERLAKLLLISPVRPGYFQFALERQHRVAVNEAPGSPDQGLLPAGVCSRMKVSRCVFQQEIGLVGGLSDLRAICLGDSAFPHHLEVSAVV